MEIASLRRGGTALTLLGLAGLIGVLWMSFFWVSTEINQGVVQRIFYVHVPSAWVSFMAFGISALCSAVYLWLRDERLDQAAAAAAEGGLVFATVVLSTGPIWGRVAIVGALDIPFIHLSVVWFRSLHPEPVVVKAEGPTLPGDMLTTLFVALAVFTVLFAGLFFFRYALEGLRAEADRRDRRSAA
jgi:heme exporter protein C